MEFIKYKRQIQLLIGKQHTLKEQLNNERINNKQLKKRKIAIEEAQVLIQKVAKETQEQLCYHIEDIVQSMRLFFQIP